VVPEPEPVGGPGPSTSTTCPAGAIAVALSSSIQSAINAYPNGTTFCIKAGLRRMTASILPKSGNKFVGEYGAVLNGSKVLTGAVKSGSTWYYTGQTQTSGSTLTDYCQVGYPRCNYTNDLFIDNVPMQHVGLLSDVGPGKWYFDYAAQRIYIGDDPAGKTVETSTVSMAFAPNGVDNVTVENLVLEKYANKAQIGVVHAGSRSGWIVQNNEVRLSHGLGIRVGTGGRILNNFVHHLGQMGIGAGGDSASGTVISGIIADGNELAYNNFAHYSTGWEGGGCKFAVSDGTILRNNFSHHNDGPGLWMDTNNIRTLIEHNTVEDNTENGIRVEIGFSTIIRYNVVRRNALRDVNRWLFGAGILNQNTRDVEIYGNTLEDNGGGISAIMQNRALPVRLFGYSAFTIDNFSVHDNSVKLTIGINGVAQDIGDTSWFTSHGVRYQKNTYELGANSKYLAWQNATRTETEWKNYGNDTSGQFIR